MTREKFKYWTRFFLPNTLWPLTSSYYDRTLNCKFTLHFPFFFYIFFRRQLANLKSILYKLHLNKSSRSHSIPDLIPNVNTSQLKSLRDRLFTFIPKTLATVTHIIVIAFSMCCYRWCYLSVLSFNGPLTADSNFTW